MICVIGENCLDAWKNGCSALINNSNEVFNLFTTISNPHLLEDAWLNDYDPKSTDVRNSKISDVINTIFPYRIHKNDRNELYAYYLRLHRSSKRLGSRKTKRWGTYFERMISFGDEGINQLEEIIGVINSDKRHLRIMNPMHITSCEYDSLKKRLGTPCLQYIQFSFPAKNIIDASVVYRNHDFLNKTLGNFIGLGQLLNFVAKNTNKQVGQLSCLSIHAFTNHKNQLIKLSGI